MLKPPVNVHRLTTQLSGGPSDRRVLPAKSFGAVRCSVWIIFMASFGMGRACPKGLRAKRIIQSPSGSRALPDDLRIRILTATQILSVSNSEVNPCGISVAAAYSCRLLLLSC